MEAGIADHVAGAKADNRAKRRRDQSGFTFALF
jgi:hypothetical protein